MLHRIRIKGFEIEWRGNTSSPTLTYIHYRLGDNFFIRFSSVFLLVFWWFSERFMHDKGLPCTPFGRSVQWMAETLQSFYDRAKTTNYWAYYKWQFHNFFPHCLSTNISISFYRHILYWQSFFSLLHTLNIESRCHQHHDTLYQILS